MQRSLPRNLLWALLFLFVVGAILLGHELIAEPGLQKARISEAVAGFSCPDLVVTHPRGSWNQHRRLMRSALHMPAPCLADLKRRISGDPRFRRELCNAVEECWTRREGNRSYTFIFYPNYAGFRFERN